MSAPMLEQVNNMNWNFLYIHFVHVFVLNANFSKVVIDTCQGSSN
jgi:hypothetical protein